jgi:hypothetical protein
MPWLPFLAPTQSLSSFTFLLQASTMGGLCPPQLVFLLGDAPSHFPLLSIGSSYFSAKLFPV